MLQALLDGLIYTAIGVGIVFIALVILMYAVKLIGVIVVAIEKDGSNKKAKTPQVAEEVASSVEDGISPEVVAAITAAVTMMYSRQPNVQFVVKKIKRF